MKKILFCIPSLRDGGAEKVLVNLVNNLDSRKYDVTILTIVDSGVNKKFIKDNIKYRSIFKKYFRGSTFILKIFSPKYIYKKYIGDEYDIVIAYLEGAAVRIISGADSSKAKKIAWIHTEFTDKKSFSKGFRGFREGIRCYEKFDRIECVSQMVKHAFQDITKTNVHLDVMYNTNETEVIVNKSKDKLSDILFKDNVYNLCSVGKIIESKGFDRLARIHKRLMSEGIINNIYILGEGKDQQKIYRYLEKEGLADSFIFLGYKDNPYKYISKCDLYVCASKKEGFSTAVTESLIVGTPVITTRCSGMEELLGNNNEYGIIVENDEDSLYNGIVNLLRNQELLDEYKLKAYIRGKQFSKDYTISAVEMMLDNL